MRIEKPFQAPRVATKPKSEPATNPDDASTPPVLEEWPDIASADRAKVDVSQLSSHQIEDILRLFDLNPTYGPFVGVDRLFRWQRADKWGLEPPLLIKDLIESKRALSRPEAGFLW